MPSFYNAALAEPSAPTIIKNNADARILCGMENVSFGKKTTARVRDIIIVTSSQIVLLLQLL